MRPALQGHVLTRFEAASPAGRRAEARATRIDLVEARGKHLLIHFEGGLVLRTHLRMTGSWHVYRERERWRKPPYLARAVVGADSGWVAVCFQAPVVETYHRQGAEPIGAGRSRSRPVPRRVPDRRGPRSDRRARRSARERRHDARRGTARPTDRRRHRQRVQVGGVLRGRHRPRHGDGARRRAHAPPRVVDRRPPAPGQPRPGGAPHAPRRSGRLRPPGPAVPAMRHADPHGAPRRPGPEHLLVPDLPAAGRPPNFVRHFTSGG